MTFDASQALRYAMDFGLAVPSIVGVSEYAVYLVTIANDQVDINDTDNNRVVYTSRITVADGYRNYAAGDGFLNPIIAQENSEQLIISNGQLTSDKLLLGPLVFPYTLNSFSGGTDPIVFQPPLNNVSNLQVYIQIQGAGLSLSGNFFTVSSVKIDDMSGLSYYVGLKSSLLQVN